MVGGVVTVLAMLVICGGMGRVARVTEWMVPIMAGIYIVVALGIMLYNITEMPHVFYIILRDAFDWQAVFGGGMGAAVLTGFKRGLFSNEAGEGSVPNAAATADATHPVVQGLIQAFGVYVDTLFICSASAFIVLLTGDYSATGLTGIELIQWDMTQYFGNGAPKAVSFLIFLFAFTSLIGNYYYGKSTSAISPIKMAAEPLPPSHCSHDFLGFHCGSAPCVEPGGPLHGLYGLNQRKRHYSSFPPGPGLPSGL